MPKDKATKRTYNSEARNAQAAQTKKRILDAAKKLFQTIGFDTVTIEKLAAAANVSIPTVYALFESKLGVLRALIDEALPSDQHAALVEKGNQETTPAKRLSYAAKISRQLYDAEKMQLSILHGASVIAPELKKLEKEREMRRHKRLEDGIKRLARERSLQPSLSTRKALDILWVFTGRDIYRMLVIEQKWTSAKYEKWLAELLVKSLLK